MRMPADFGSSSVAKVRGAALAIPWRRRQPDVRPAGEALEVYLVTRAPELSFFGGYASFPGGAVDRDDGSVPVAGEVPSDRAERARIACAARELFEETGILACRVADAGGARPPPEVVDECRRQLGGPSGSAESFSRFLEQHGLAVDADAFQYVTRLVTPPFSSRRYDASFFLVETETEPAVVEGELDGGRWYSPLEALGSWRLGELRVAAPAVAVLEELSRRPLPEAVAKLRDLPAQFEGCGRGIPMAPGYEVLPLEADPLPASIPANAFLVGWRRFILVDPGPKGERGQEHLVRAVERRIDEGDALEAIVLTHHHVDHVSALDAVRSRHPSPVWAHRITGELLSLELDRELEDGDSIDLGEGPDGRSGWRLEALFTPGHARGHLALHDPRHRSLIGGDLVSTLLSMYVGYPGGDIGEYLRSLERIRELPLDTLYPSHGAPTHEVRGLIDEVIEHRMRRIEQTFRLLGEDPRDVESIAVEVYPRVAGALRELIVRATRAVLRYLAAEGRAREVAEDSWSRR